MSVQTEITRLNTAKSDIATAITNKGVTVPDGTMLDKMAAIVDAIEAASELAEEMAVQDELIAQLTIAAETASEAMAGVEDCAGHWGYAAQRSK